MLDAAERSFRKYGYHASSMKAVAREAGYTRTMLYRHFATREDLNRALVERTTLRHVANIADRLHEPATLAELIVEANVIVATELAEDPLCVILAEQIEASNVAKTLINAEPFMETIVSLLDQWSGGEKDCYRKGISTADAAKFLIASGMSLLLGIGPDPEDPDNVRRYVTAFILPAIMAKPPPPGDVFAS